MTKEWTNIFEGAHSFFGKLYDTRIWHLLSALTIKTQRGQFQGMGGEGRRAHEVFNNRQEKRKTEGFYHFPKSLIYSIQTVTSEVPYHNPC